MTPEAARAVNVRLIQSERQLTDAAGLPRRPWYRHLLYAPGYYTGYAVKTMPGVREAIEEELRRGWAEIVQVARALEREKALVEAAAAGSREAEVGPLLRLLCGLSSPQFVRVGRCCWSACGRNNARGSRSIAAPLGRLGAGGVRRGGASRSCNLRFCCRSIAV